jgi:NAD(P)-dependent dehydrogenase (short-subunit alcohol dehydrogenase family)
MNSRKELKMNPKQKTYVVSGAGGGIGRAIAVKLASGEGNTIVLLGRNREKLQETRSLLPNSSSHFLLPVDLRKPQEVKVAFEDIKLSTRNLAGVIANAGIGGENQYGAGDRWSEILETNLTGTYSLVNEALPSLLEGKEVRAEQLNMVPLRKMSRPEEVAALVNFLVAGEQVSITGQVIDINNGALMV